MAGPPRSFSAAIRTLFEHRSARVIAASRLVLAVTFFFAVWIDPSQPASHQEEGYAILGGYVLLAVYLLTRSWNDWWFDYKAGGWSHFVDIFVFIAGVFLTEAYTSSFTSPFFSFFAFLLLSATLRWGWRGTALTAAIAILCYAVVGLGVQFGRSDFDPYRFGRRTAYLLVLSFVLVWFGLNKFQPLSRTALSDREDTSDLPINTALDHAAAMSRAQRVLLAWWQPEEPWTTISVRETDCSIRHERLGPDQVNRISAALTPGHACLFDLPAGRAIRFERVGSVNLEETTSPVDPAFGQRFAIKHGIVVSINASDVEGFLFLLEAPGLASDDLEMAQQIGVHLTSLFDRHASRAAAQSAAEERARHALARDLHDSVSQSLSGAAFQLEAVLGEVRRGENAEPGLLALKSALLAEQRHLRELIGNLRTGTIASRLEDAGASICDLGDDLARQWAVEVICTAPPQRIILPSWYLHELRQIVREGVANGARHGRANKILINLSTEAGRLRLLIEDNGVGFLEAGEHAHPWSIQERVVLLGGEVSLSVESEATRLVISLPLPGTNDRL